MTMPALPQLIPSSRCLSCDVCCRFPVKDSPLAPYFTQDEISRAINLGLPPERFPHPAGGRIELIPHPDKEGFICPAFDPATNGCRIYSNRPLDCQLFPLALMWDPSGRVVLLGYDRKCPFIAESLLEAAPYEYSGSVAARLESAEMIRSLGGHPGLIGDYQEDVMVLAALPRLGEALTGQKADTRSPPCPEAVGLTPLAASDRALFETAMKGSRTELSSHAWATWMIWKDHFKFYWKVRDGRFCLFARYGDGLFMPLPPIGGHPTGAIIRHCFDTMESINTNPDVSRIENIDEDHVPDFQNLGYVVKAKEREYLYDRKALALLTGDRYKAKRWACNRFMRDHQDDLVRFERYRSADLNECLELFFRWRRQASESASISEKDRERMMMLEDAASVHRRAFEAHSDLGLTGRVVRLNGRIVGYTFGFPLRPDIFCVLLEVADREMTGLSAYLFREFCRELSGYSTIHAMDDSGLDRLRRAKLSYHPSKILSSYIATRPT
jgi:uncharacterized protein